MRSTWFATAALAALAPCASANCSALIDALEKAQSQERLAQYEVASRNVAPQGQPRLVRIGKSEYMGYSVGERISHYERHDSVGNPVLRALKRSPQARCASSDDSYRGTAALKVQSDTPPATVWIDKRSGLPVYHEVSGFEGGFAWTYGDAVKEPSLKK